MFTLPELPYAYNALEPFIDETTMKIHHDKHHAAYIKNANDALTGLDAFSQMPVETLLTKLEDLPENIRTKVKNNAGGHFNHSLFWMMMSPNPKGALRQAQDDLGIAINKAFGSFEKFQELFTVSTLSRFGSGWVWLVLNKGALEVVDTPNQDSPLSEGKTPILGLDVWEHAYYLKYQNMRAEYVKAWWNVVNWKEVSDRYGRID
ncbi:superoxide dismutase [Candidatus Gottesmanbacteria bacterium]|nr:superoxide dismutase [Candidatus Gottesmanbacteria bacterium]